MTVLEVIQKSAEFLAKKGVESARLQTELLLAHVLRLPRMQLYLNFERAVSDVELDTVRELVKRRGQREPLQHIIGSTSFCGLEIAVNRHVLVPRPETELLAELGWQFLNTIATESERGTPVRRETDLAQASQRADLEIGASTALDFGTGSGCIAIALAVKCPNARLTALDASAEALAVARKNATRNGVGDRLELRCEDGFAQLPADARFNLIVSNPPYIPSAEIASLQPEVRDFDPRSALDGGADGLDFHRLLAEQAGPFLQPGGRLMLEFGDGQAEAVGQIFVAQKWIVEAVKDDYSQRPRHLITRREEVSVRD